MATAEAIAKALGGQRAGATWMARCPAHEDREPSLSISSGKDSKVLVRCHAGCDQRDVIAALRDRGLWEVTGKIAGRFARKQQRRVPDEPDPDVLKRTKACACDLAGIASGRRNFSRNLSAVARARTCRSAHPALSPRTEAPLGRRLACNGGAGDARL